MNLLKKIDYFFFTYLGITTIFLLFSWNQSEQIPNLLLIRFFILISIIVLIQLDFKKKSFIINFLRNTYPIILSMYFYSRTYFYNKFLFADLDPYLIKYEQAIFGFQPSLEFSKYFSSKWFSELMYIGYFSFYILIGAFVIYLYNKKKEVFLEVSFKLAASMLLFYFIFGFLSSAGPQFYFLTPDNIAPNAFIFDKIIQFIIKNGDLPTGAFPSSHVGISVVILILSKKYAPNYFKFAWPFVIILIPSIVYIKAHYALDAIGGIIIAPLILYISSKLYRIPLGVKTTI